MTRLSHSLVSPGKLTLVQTVPLQSTVSPALSAGLCWSKERGALAVATNKGALQVEILPCPHVELARCNMEMRMISSFPNAPNPHLDDVEISR